MHDDWTELLGLGISEKALILIATKLEITSRRDTERCQALGKHYAMATKPSNAVPRKTFSVQTSGPPGSPAVQLPDCSSSANLVSNRAAFIRQPKSPHSLPRI